MVIITDDYLLAVNLDNKNKVRAEVLFEQGCYLIDSIFLKGLIQLNYHIGLYLVKHNYSDRDEDIGVYVMSREEREDDMESDIEIKKIVTLADVLEPIIEEGEMYYE